MGGEWTHLFDLPTTPVHKPSMGAFHLEGRENVQFFTQLMVAISHWFICSEGDVWYRAPMR
jgi:hypothetical protein